MQRSTGCWESSVNVENFTSIEDSLLIPALQDQLVLHFSRMLPSFRLSAIALPTCDALATCMHAVEWLASRQPFSSTIELVWLTNLFLGTDFLPFLSVLGGVPA